MEDITEPEGGEVILRSRQCGHCKVAECVDIGVMDFEKLVAFAGEQAIDLVVVGPDDPLAAGAVDAFENAGIRVFGPRKKCCHTGSFQGIFQGFDEEVQHPFCCL